MNLCLKTYDNPECGQTEYKLADLNSMINNDSLQFKPQSVTG